MYTLQQIKESLPIKKNSKSSWWVKLIIRKLSFLFTFVFINLGFSAKQVSLLSVAVAIAGSLCLGINSYRIMIVGMLLINFWLVLDCVDGNIARCKKTSSLMGSFIDAISGYTVLAFVYLGIGIAAYNTTFIVPEDYKHVLIICGAVVSISDILARLIHQKYLYTLSVNGQLNTDKKPEVENKKSLSYIRGRIDKEVGISGLFMPMLIVSSLLNVYDLMLIFYLVFNLVGLIGVMIMYSSKCQ